MLKRKLSFLLILMGFLFLGCAPVKIPPKAIKGVLDLREWDFDPPTGSGTDGIVKLDGEWEFYWEEFPQINESGELSLPEEKKDYIKVPGVWNGFKPRSSSKNEDIEQEGLKGNGYATYRLKVLLRSPMKLAFRINEINTCGTIYLNRTILSKYGITGKDKSTSFVTRNPIKYLYSINQSDNDELEIIIPISNFHHARGGLGNSLSIGLDHKVRYYQISNLFQQAFVSGIIFIISIYHLSLFSLRKNDKSNIYFSLFCLVIFIRSILMEEKIFFFFFPNFSYEISYKIEYITIYISFLSSMLFFQNIFINIISKMFVKIILILCVMMTILILLSHTNIYTNTLIVSEVILITVIIYIYYLFIKGFQTKIEGINILIIGFVILSIISINDILHIRQFINTGIYLPIGLVFLIFSQSYLISSRFSKAFEEVKTLSSTLQISNHELELTKERATKAYLDLEASQKQLVQSDKMITLGTMVAGVAHEINTPLGAIKANSENIQESLRGLLLQLNPSLSHISLDDLQNAMGILDLIREPKTALSSREARALRKQVIAILEEKNQKSIEIITDYILDLGLMEAIERDEPILRNPDLEKYLSIASELHGIRKKSIVIQTSADRVSKIVKSLKSFMHFDPNETKMASDLTEGMETVLIILHNKIKYGIEVIKNYGENVPQIACYPDELNQVWTNLIHNAIQAMGEKGTLQIDIERLTELTGIPDIDKRNPEYGGGYVAVSIQDSGSGISPEIRTKIFQAFFTTKPAGEGSGLGLHIIGKILEKHAGALYLQSEPGKTRFTVVLPVEATLV